jgi:site-specific recombinase XerD
VRSIEGTDTVFRTKTGHAWTRSWLCTLMRRAVDACPEIPLEKRKQVSFHALRHSFASFLAMDGMNTRKLQEALAHGDPRLTARYSHLGDEATVEVQQRIARILGSQPDQVREGYHRGYQAPSAG